MIMICIIFIQLNAHISAKFECVDNKTNFNFNEMTQLVIINQFVSVLYSNDSDTLVLYNFENVIQGSLTFNAKNSEYVDLILKNYWANNEVLVHPVLVIGDVDVSVGIVTIGVVITHSSYINTSITVGFDNVDRGIDVDEIVDLIGFMEQSFTGPYQCGVIVIWTLLEDGSHTDLSDEPELEFTIIDSFAEDLEIRYVDKGLFDESGDR